MGELRDECPMMTEPLTAERLAEIEATIRAEFKQQPVIAGTALDVLLTEYRSDAAELARLRADAEATKDWTLRRKQYEENRARLARENERLRADLAAALEVVEAHNRLYDDPQKETQ
jgi:hypothetical protein